MESFGGTRAGAWPTAGRRSAAKVRTSTRSRRSGSDFIAALDRVSDRITDPVAKLRYIRNSLARYQRAARILNAVPFPLVRRLLFRWLSLEGLQHLVTANPMGQPIAGAGAQGAVWLSRGLAAAVGLGLLAGLAVGGYRLSRSAGEPTVQALVAPAIPPAALPVVAEELAPQAATVKPAAVWQVEKGAGWEQYSNGLRIDTSHAVEGEPRRYRLFRAPGGAEGDVLHKPVGILFHTSESDIWPLKAAYNENLRDSSHRLLVYVNKNRLYNYLIDRFGRAFRVVGEETKANHAGASIWSQGDAFYLSLNNAFLAICFETRWEGGRALPITQAQLATARSLTEYLRQRWEIAPEMCVTHGLTSVNPKKHLIGHHVDWARGFPFEAFGLPNQYDRVAPSVAVFGFVYDDQFLKVLGEPWAGVKEAEGSLVDEARRRGLRLDDVRREKQGLYDQWYSEVTREEEARAAHRADPPPTSTASVVPTASSSWNARVH